MKRNDSFKVAIGWVYAATVSGLLAATGGGTALASETPPHVTVRFGDLDLSSAEGVSTLYRRIQAAARSVCDQSVPASDPIIGLAWKGCYRTAVANAVAKVNNAQLIAMHQQETFGRIG